MPILVIRGSFPPADEPCLLHMYAITTIPAPSKVPTKSPSQSPTQGKTAMHHIDDDPPKPTYYIYTY